MWNLFRKSILCILTALVLLAILNVAGFQQPVYARYKTSPLIDAISQQVITNIRTNGWNPLAQTHGVTTGGLYINWKMSNPSLTNAGNENTVVSHDIQVDLSYLNALAEYIVLHPQDHNYDGELQKILPIVTSEFANYNVAKGWIYFYLLRDGLMLHNDTLMQEAQSAAQNFYNNWYNPAFGLIYNTRHNPADYNVEHSLNCGAALIDAGARWNRPDWAQAGTLTINNTLSAATNPTYHMLYASMSVQPNGTQQVENYEAKPSTQSNAAEALLNAYSVTHNAGYLAFAGQLLRTMLSSSLWDQSRGGLFFALDMGSNSLNQAYKETRSQTLTLIALNRYNRDLLLSGQPQQFLDQQQLLTRLLSIAFYQSTYHGYFYRTTVDYQIYSSHPGQGIGLEDYFTTEAMGTALDALQQTELLQLPF